MILVFNEQILFVGRGCDELSCEIKRNAAAVVDVTDAVDVKRFHTPCQVLARKGIRPGGLVDPLFKHGCRRWLRC
jgi:hypothetical protein